MAECDEFGLDIDEQTMAGRSRTDWVRALGAKIRGKDADVETG